MPAGDYNGGFSGLIPLFDASGHLIVNYARNPKSFPVNNYTQMTNCPVGRGAYLRFDPISAHRIPPNMKWAFGTPRPAGHTNQQAFSQQNFVTERFQASTTLDKFGVDVASFDVQKMHTERLAEQVMLNRTRVTNVVMTTTGNYPTANVINTGTTIAGAPLDQGTTANPILFNALMAASKLIQDGTGVVKVGDLCVLMNDNTARRLARTREIREYVMQQEGAVGMIKMEKGFTLAGRYMLPDMLYRFCIFVEDARFTTSHPDAVSVTLSPTFPDDTMVVFLREGNDLEKGWNVGGFTSFTQFVYEDMVAEANVLPFDRVVQFAVTDQFTCEMTAPPTAVLYTNIWS